jgi:hypothetical protein
MCIDTDLHMFSEGHISREFEILFDINTSSLIPRESYDTLVSSLLEEDPRP